MRTQKIILVTLIVILIGILIVSLIACSAADRQSGAVTQSSESPAQTESSQQAKTPAAPSSASSLASSNMSKTQPNDESDPSEPILPDSASGQVIISFDYVKQTGSASNQFAVWIEDMDGNYLQTVFATRWTANGGFNTRPDSVTLWVEKSDIASMPSNFVDAISGATPQTGEFNSVWDLTDIDGNTVPSGEYRVFVEGTLRWKNYVLYSSVIEIDNVPTTVQANAEFVYAGSGNQSALTSGSPENDMIGAVTVRYIPGN